MEQTRLQRKMMDSEAVKAGRDNFTSPRDTGKLLRLLVEGKVVNKEASEKMLDIMKRQQLRNKLPALLPEDVVIAHKTGDLHLMEHDVGSFSSRTHLHLAIFTNRWRPMPLVSA